MSGNLPNGCVSYKEYLRHRGLKIDPETGKEVPDGSGVMFRFNEWDVLGRPLKQNVEEAIDPNALTDEKLKIIIEGLQGKRQAQTPSRSIEQDENEDWLVPRKNPQRAGSTGSAPDLDNLVKLWEAELPALVHGHTLAAAYDKVFVGASDQCLHSFDAASGKRLSKSKKVTSVYGFRATLVTKDSVYSGDLGSIIRMDHGLDWNLKSQNLFNTSYVLEDERMYYLAKHNGHQVLFCAKERNLAPIWGNYISSNRAIFDMLICKEKLVLATEGFTYAFAKDTGDILWQEKYETNRLAYDKTNGTLWARGVINQTGTIMQIDPDSGTAIKLKSSEPSFEYPVVSNGKVAYLKKDGLDAFDSEIYLIGSFHTKLSADRIGPSAADSKVFQPDKNKIFCFDGSGKELIYQDSFEAERHIESPLVIYHGSLLFTSGRKLYCYANR